MPILLYFLSDYFTVKPKYINHLETYKIKQIFKFLLSVFIGIIHSEMPAIPHGGSQVKHRRNKHSILLLTSLLSRALPALIASKSDF